MAFISSVISTKNSPGGSKILEFLNRLISFVFVMEHNATEALVKRFPLLSYYQK